MIHHNRLFIFYSDHILNVVSGYLTYDKGLVKNELSHMSIDNNRGAIINELSVFVRSS